MWVCSTSFVEKTSTVTYCFIILLNSALKNCNICKYKKTTISIKRPTLTCNPFSVLYCDQNIYPGHLFIKTRIYKCVSDRYIEVLPHTYPDQITQYVTANEKLRSLGVSVYKHVITGCFIFWVT